MRPLQVSASTCQRFHLAFIGRWVSWRRIQWSLVQVAGAYRASGMELRSQSAAAAGSATALHVASLPPLILLAPDKTLLCLCLRLFQPRRRDSFALPPRAPVWGRVADALAIPGAADMELRCVA